jgi:hypothetical protein
MAKPISIAAMAAAALVAATLVVAYGQRTKQERPLRAPTRSVEAAPETSGRCAISQARFGARGAQLVKVMKGSVPNYVVIETGKRDPLMRLQRSRWLRAAYGDGEQTWLGEFASAETAMTKATRLCPADLRCWPGDTDCGPLAQPLTPAQAFLPR